MYLIGTKFDFTHLVQRIYLFWPRMISQVVGCVFVYSCLQVWYVISRKDKKIIIGIFIDVRKKFDRVATLSYLTFTGSII